MVEIGYTLSSEEHAPGELLLYGRIAEEVGFDFLTISDHFHPWTPRQGNSPLVWSVLGGLAVKTEHIRIGTGVTCPIMRQHPTFVAQAAATAAALLPGRFFLGLGTGENLNEHILGVGWPHPRERLEMLEEAIHLIRLLWTGDLITEWTDHYTVDRARIYTLPDELPPIFVAAAVPAAAELAGRSAEGLIATAPDAELVKTFMDAGGRDAPLYAQLAVCYGPEEEKAKQEALEWWPNTSIPGELGVELAEPEQFEQVASLVTAEAVAEKVVCGPNPDAILERIGAFVDAGFDHVFIHQVGPRQEEFLEFAQKTLLPAIEGQWGRSSASTTSGAAGPSERHERSTNDGTR